MTKHDEKPTHHGPKSQAEEHHAHAPKKSAPPPTMIKEEEQDVFVAPFDDDAKAKEQPKGNAKPHAAASAAAAKPKATRQGCTLCKVTGTSIKYNGKLIPEGTVAEFDDATVLDMPGVLVSQEE
jgi:hypothetical protein